MHAAKRGEKVYGSQRRIRIDGHANPPPVDFTSIEEIRDFAASEIVRLSGGWALIFCTPEGVRAWRDALEASAAKYKRACVWVKPDSAPQFNGQGPAMGAEMFVTAWCGSGHSRWNGGGRRNVFVHSCQPPDRTGLHPTEKPLGLMKELVGLFSDGSDLVLDPFMGSGTTGVACAASGRRFIGVEKDLKYFDLACRRIEEATKQADLFFEPPKSKPIQTSIFEAMENA
jgi:DNA modification methylase